MALGEFDSSKIQHPVSTDHGLSLCTCCNLKIVALEKPVVQLELFKQYIGYTLQSMLALHEADIFMTKGPLKRARSTSRTWKIS